MLQRFPGGTPKGRVDVSYGQGAGLKMEEVMAWMAQEQILIRKIEKTGLSLESLFLEVVGK